MDVCIEILYFKGCPTFEPTRRMVESVVVGRTDAKILLVDVEAGESSRRAFLGSPSVLVNGRDIDPASEPTDNHQLCCRVFRDGADMRPEPPTEWLVAAIERAHRAEQVLDAARI